MNQQGKLSTPDVVAEQPQDTSATTKLGLGAKLPLPESVDGPIKVRNKIPQQTIIMLIVLTVSAGAIFAMRKLGTKAGIAMGGEIVQYTPPDSERTKSYARIMDELSSIQTPLDVALGEFGKSPFMLRNNQAQPLIDPVSAAMPTPEQTAAEDAKRRLEQRKQELRDKASLIVVQSVIDGRVPIARINGEMFRVGDVVSEVFTITGIKERTVTFEADGIKFTSVFDVNASGTKSAPMRVGGGAKKNK